MAFLCRPAKGSKLIISDGLDTMLSHQPQTLQLNPHHSISLGLMVNLQRFHSLGVQRVVRHEHLAQISLHDLSLSSWICHTTPCHQGTYLAYHC